MMPFKIVILWTDAILFLLIAIVVAFCFYARARPHMSQPWRYVVHSKQGMAALVFLVFFLVVGVLDSLHFRPQLTVTHETQRATFFSKVETNTPRKS
jgi:peptide/nickel transport system permease protein